jgi:3-dehydroquinate dehydratase/shikimate dehydrogenase
MGGDGQCFPSGRATPSIGALQRILRYAQNDDRGVDDLVSVGSHWSEWVVTILTASFRADTLDSVRHHAEQAWASGAEAVELRIDEFRDAPEVLADYLRQQADKTWILTCRSVAEGGRCAAGPADRWAWLQAAARETNAYVDFEWSDWQRGFDATWTPTWRGRPRLILSSHPMEGGPGDAETRTNEMLSGSEAIAAKFAYRPADINDSFAALDLMHRFGDRVVAVCMEEEGLWTRILAKKFGAFASYAALDDGSSTAPGQCTVREMRERFRWASQNAETRVFGVMGDPVSQSLSPALFNHWFAEQGINAVYVPLRVTSAGGGAARFLAECRRRPWLLVGGLSVTHPHKTAVFAASGAAVDRAGQSIGAVNTLVFREGRVFAHNTDSHAALDSLIAALGISRTDLRGLPVDILGAGGAARAVLSVLRDYGADVTLYARSEGPRRRLQAEFGCLTLEWPCRVARQGKVLINCTNVGMAPHIPESPMPPDALIGCELVFDLIYNPSETQLLKDASLRGIRTLNGMDMFIRQAAVQFELFTGRSPDSASALRLLTHELGWHPPATAASRFTPVVSRGDTQRVEGRDAEDLKRTIALIGLRGTGKTAVGRALAELLNDWHVDTDEVVEQQAGKSIATIFAEEGEDGFRRRESAALALALAQAPAVLSVGGGAILQPRNVDLLRSRTRVVRLTAPNEVLVQRLSNDPTSTSRRPALTGLPPAQEIERLRRERAVIEESVSELDIDTSARTPKAIALEIATALLGLPAA